LPTGFASLDKALGIGGLPRGQLVEIFGPASCGKTALALQMVGNLQHNGGAAAWVDAEHAFDATFAAHLGVEVSRLPVVAPESTEQACDMARRLAASGVLDLLVIDSAAALIPEVELETGFDTQTGALHSRVLGSALRRLAPSARRSGAAILFLNQIRIRPEPGVAQPETSAGGPSLKLYAAVRIGLFASGRTVRFRIVKNKLAGAFGTGELYWRPCAVPGKGERAGFVEAGSQ
jgi:recombination protein RecA